jgi:hypothetical protein
MTTAREDRFVENEKLFRSANERLRDRVEDIVAPESADSVPVRVHRRHVHGPGRADARGVRKGAIR